MTLWSEFLANDGRVIDKWAHYFPVYERHFARFVDTDVTFFEIGCGEGGSLRLWKRYLGPLAKIVGIDINPECASFAEDQIDVRIGDQGDPDFLEALVAEFGAPDVVLDDGSHKMPDVNISFATLYPKVARNGVYLVEDLHTAYWDEYGGGLAAPATFIENCKALVDELNSDHSRGALPPTLFSRSTLSMHFYDSIAVFEKGHSGEKRSLRIGAGA